MTSTEHGPRLGFDDADLAADLDRLGYDELDRLSFGLITMDGAGVVLAYNSVESRHSGLDPTRVVGRRFFADIGPCCDNATVAGRYDTGDDLDAVIDYVFTFRLLPVPVRLRLMHRSGAERQYLAVVPR